MFEITQGTIETVIADVADRLQQMTELPNPGTTFEVRAKDGTVVQGATAANTDGMTALCLVDTTHTAGQFALWPPDIYSLYLMFNNAQDIPKIGPMKFMVNP